MDNPLKNILGSINKLVGGTEDNAVGIDIGSSAIKIVEIKRLNIAYICKLIKKEETKPNRSVLVTPSALFENKGE